MALLRKRVDVRTDAPTEPFVVAPGQEPLFPPLPPPSGARPSRRRWPVVVAASALLIGAAAAAVAVYLTTRGPDLQAFNATLGDLVELTETIQSSTDALDAPRDLSGYAATIGVRLDDLDSVETDAVAVDSARHREALATAVEREARYVRELERLARLAPSAVTTDELAAVRDFADSAEASLAAALALGPEEGRDRVDHSPAALARVLAAYRREWTQSREERAAALRINRRRAASLASLQAFTEDFDGIVARYSSSRHELAEWIDKVDTVGVTYTEAYQVLYQQAERRRQLRSELAALRAPAAFAQDKQAVLAAMDLAIDATEAAARGISEYQSDYSYSYGGYDETPGWVQFEAASDEISDAYGTAIAAYTERKETLFARLSKRVPVPSVVG